MALMRAKEIPADAVSMDELEATTYIWDIVSNWEKTSDTWALRYGPVVLGGVNAVSGLVINRHYRNKLKLGHYGFMSSALPITVMPAFLTLLFHRHLVSTNMLLMKRESCPVCYEVKSGALQLALGIAYPMVLGPASAMMFANRYGTYRVPDLQEGSKVIFSFLKKITKPLSSTLVFLSAFQLVSSSVITYFEMRNNFSLRKQLIEIENKVIAEEGNYNTFR